MPTHGADRPEGYRSKGWKTVFSQVRSCEGATAFQRVEYGSFNFRVSATLVGAAKILIKLTQYGTYKA